MGPLSRPGVPLRRGYSLIEAILASFLMVFVFFLVSRLFHSGFQLASQVESRIAAVRFAEKRMMAVRRWAKTTINWTSPPAELTTPNDPEFPGFTVSVQGLDTAAETLSPCLELEAGFPTTNRRNLPTVARLVTVRVSRPGTPGFALTSKVTRMESNWGLTADIRISPSTATIAGPDQEVEFTVQAFDEAGNPDPDIFFHWEVEPEFGLGNPATTEIRNKTRDGRTVIVRNRVRRRSGLWVPQNGFCRLVAYARYRGHIRRGDSGVITLLEDP